jgi:hypothetical protein
MAVKSAEYWQGRNEESARIAARDARRSALDAHPNFHDIAREVGKNLVRDNAHRQRIFQRSPHVFAAMDAEEVAQASSRELAMRELQELGIDNGDNDPLAILDAHHAGRQYARDGGGKPLGMEGNKTLGMDSGNPSLDKYLQE